MFLLKRENWWIWLLLTLFSSGSNVLVLGALLDCFDKDEWYAKPTNWLIGIICFIFPLFIMMTVLMIQMTARTAAKLEVPGKEIYLSSFVWIICFIVPVIGWIIFTVMLLYLQIWILVSLYRGNGEIYIK